MTNKIKGFLLAFVGVCAVFSSAFAVHGAVTSPHRGAAAEPETVNAMAVGSESCYVLRDYEGYVAVFIENEPDLPMTVTDIQVSTLREFDQILLQTGMKVQTHERLTMMLEDLGS